MSTHGELPTPGLPDAGRPRRRGRVCRARCRPARRHPHFGLCLVHTGGAGGPATAAPGAMSSVPAASRPSPDTGADSGAKGTLREFHLPLFLLVIKRSKADDKFS